jgi:ubiquitin-conjugating enzyme (huntingtin interacting protein 2)
MEIDHCAGGVAGGVDLHEPRFDRAVHLHARAQMALMNRIKKEAAELSDDSDSAGVSATPISEDLKRWKGTISGPKETPCDGCTFAIDIELTNNYPFEPPKMKFDTTVWHPNVSSRTGAICLNILQKEWSPALTIKTALITVQALLAEHLVENTNLEAKCLAFAMLSHRRLGKGSLWAKEAIEDSILRMVCEEHVLFSQTCRHRVQGTEEEMTRPRS